MRKRKKPGPIPSVNTEVFSTANTAVRPPDKNTGRDLHSAEAQDFLIKVLAGVLVPLVVAAVTLFAAFWQFNTANERTERARFLDGALATAQETSLLLGEGYNALEKLLHATGSNGWTAFSAGALSDYMKFHRHWRQQAVSEHFKLARYFGKDLADQLIHIDEIDLHPIDNLGSPNPCAPSGTENEFDIEKMTFQTWCTITRIPLLQDALDDKRTFQSQKDLFEILQEKREKADFAKKLLHGYDQAMVGYLRQLNDRLTQLGQPQVSVVARSTSAGARVD